MQKKNVFHVLDESGYLLYVTEKETEAMEDIKLGKASAFVGYRTLYAGEHRQAQHDIPFFSLH